MKGIVYKKPVTNEVGKQLFSIDANTKGAKGYIFETYENIYKRIKENKTANIYEDNTYAEEIKLFIDYDENMVFGTKLERDKYSDKIMEIIVERTNKKLEERYGIKDSEVIVLQSDTLKKMSLHIIYPKIVFENIYEMKIFMSDMEMIDKNGNNI